MRAPRLSWNAALVFGLAGAYGVWLSLVVIAAQRNAWIVLALMVTAGTWATARISVALLTNRPERQAAATTAALDGTAESAGQTHRTTPDGGTGPDDPTSPLGHNVSETLTHGPRGLASWRRSI